MQRKIDYKLLRKYAPNIIKNLGLKKTTAQYYLQALVPFFDYLDKRGDFTVQSFAEYCEYLAVERTELSPQTRQKYYQVTRKYLKLLFNKGILKADITIHVKNILTTQKNEVVYTPSANKVIDWNLVAWSYKPEEFARYRLIYLLAKRIGQAQTANLKYEDINWEEQLIGYQKQRRQYFAAFTPELIEAFALFIVYISTDDSDNYNVKSFNNRYFNCPIGYVFYGYKNQPINDRSVRKIIRMLEDKHKELMNKPKSQVHTRAKRLPALRNTV